MLNAATQAHFEAILSNPERLTVVSERIASSVSAAHEDGNFILERDASQISHQLRGGMATFLPATTPQGTDSFLYYMGAQYLPTQNYHSEYPVIEGGTLIANSDKELLACSRGRASDVVQNLGRLAFIPSNGLIIYTSRSTPSVRALTGGGAKLLQRRDFPMLDALTCDSACLPSPQGPIATIGTIAVFADGSDRIECPVNEAYADGALADACFLLTNDCDRAYEMESRLSEDFNGSAQTVRATLIGGA